MKNHKMKRGVTLVEIAIVLVIIGLLLGGVLKGQELINNAKVRSIADRQNSLKVAWFSFIDRYQALPGDYVRAEQNVPGAASPADHPTAGDGFITVEESPIVFQNLTGAGYLRCPQCTDSSVKAVGTRPTAGNSLQNQYGGIMSIWHDGSYYATTGAAGGPRLLIHTGSLIPSNIVAEVDRKLDDGLANTGDMVHNDYNANTTSLRLPVLASEGCQADDAGDPVINSVLTQATPIAYRWANSTPPIATNCGASITI